MSISVHEHYRRLLLLPEQWEVTKVEDHLSWAKRDGLAAMAGRHKGAVFGLR